QQDEGDAERMTTNQRSSDLRVTASGVELWTKGGLGLCPSASAPASDQQLPNPDGEPIDVDRLVRIGTCRSGISARKRLARPLNDHMKMIENDVLQIDGPWLKGTPSARVDHIARSCQDEGCLSEVFGKIHAVVARLSDACEVGFHTRKVQYQMSEHDDLPM